MLLFQNITGLWFLALIPAIFILYSLFFKRKEKQVAGIFLWIPTQELNPRGGKIELPPFSKSLLLDLLAALVLVLLALKPFLPDNKEVSHHLFLLDASLSMGSLDQTPLKGGKAWLKRRLSEFSPQERATLLLCGKEPTLVGEALLTPSKAISLLESWKPEAPSCHWKSAFHWAKKLNPHRVTFLSDGQGAASFPLGLETVFFGIPATNFGIFGAFREKTPSGSEELFFQIFSYGKKKEATEIKLIQEGEELKKMVLEVVPGINNFGPILLETSMEKLLSLKLKEDPLLFDNLTFLPSNSPKEKGFFCGILDPFVQKKIIHTMGLFPEFTRVEEREKAFLSFDQKPLEPSQTPLPLQIFWPSEQSLKSNQIHQVNGPFTPGSPLDWINQIPFQGRFFASIFPSPFPQQAENILNSGNFNLIQRVSHPQSLTLYLNDHPHLSNQFFHPSWPLLIKKSIEESEILFRGFRPRNIAPGEKLVFRFPASESDISLRGPDGKIQKLPGGSLEFRSNQTGIHTLLRKNHPEEFFLVTPYLGGEGELHTLNTRNLEPNSDLRGKSMGEEKKDLSFPLIILLLFLLFYQWSPPPFIGKGIGV